MLVGNFWVVGPRGETPSQTREDLRLGREVGDWLRDRLEGSVDKREGKVIKTYDLRMALERSGFARDASYTLNELRHQATLFRTDEIVAGTATRLPGGGLKLEAKLVLYRDLRMRQPLPTVTANSFDRAVALLATRVNEARLQLRHQRRCENALRDGNGARAIQSAREGIASTPRAALARTCLVWALRATGAPAAQVLAEAKELLEIDSGAPHGLEAAAVSLDTLKRRGEAADMWLRLYATDSTNMELVERVIWSMAEGGNSRRAEPLIVRLSDAYPDNMRLLRQKWRIANDNRNWPLAVAAGERLLAADAEAPGDSVFFLRLATAYRNNAQPFKAIEIVSRGVAAFPRDSRLYSLYTQFVKEESDTVIQRGLELHPGSAELQALKAKDLRARGQIAEALDASRRAIELDSTIAQGRLLVAQAEVELGRPDSALASLRRAVAAGEDRERGGAVRAVQGECLVPRGERDGRAGRFPAGDALPRIRRQPQVHAADQVPARGGRAQGGTDRADRCSEDHGEGGKLRRFKTRLRDDHRGPDEPRGRAGRVAGRDPPVPRVPRPDGSFRRQADRGVLCDWRHTGREARAVVAGAGRGNMRAPRSSLE